MVDSHWHLIWTPPACCDACGDSYFSNASTISCHRMNFSYPNLREFPLKSNYRRFARRLKGLRMFVHTNRYCGIDRCGSDSAPFIRIGGGDPTDKLAVGRCPYRPTSSTEQDQL